MDDRLPVHEVRPQVGTRHIKDEQSAWRVCSLAPVLRFWEARPQHARHRR